jgi:hypothetical protein
MRHPLFALMASAGLLACSGGGESDPATTDGQSANNNIPSAGAAVVEECVDTAPHIGPRPGPQKHHARFWSPAGRPYASTDGAIRGRQGRLQ